MTSRDPENVLRFGERPPTGLLTFICPHCLERMTYDPITGRITEPNT